MTARTPVAAPSHVEAARILATARDFVAPYVWADDANATGRKNLFLLIQLRWIAVAGQLVTIAAAIFVFKARLPLIAMAIVLGALALLNLAGLVRLRRPAQVTNVELFAVLMFDLAAFTAQLYLSGGATNPFTFLYLLQVLLAVVLLDAWSTWVMACAAMACFGALIEVHRPLDLQVRGVGEFFSLYVFGTLLCFALVAALLVIFINRINRNLRERELWLASLRERAAEEDHIVRMGLLASGAAHELGTPLSTVSVILSDWRRMPALTSDPELLAEIELIQAEVRRCKAIVTGILLSAGEARSESAAATTLHGFLDEITREWRAIHAATVLAYDDMLVEHIPIVADSALKQSIFNVLDNASEASPDWIGLRAASRSGTLMLEVTDAGPGFPAEILAQVGKPYQSSKGRQGGGLGLFLVVNVIRKLGGHFRAGNAPDGGAIVTISLPLSSLAITGGTARA